MSVGNSSSSGSIRAPLMMVKICGPMMKRRMGFSGVLSSLKGFSRTKPWKMYERFFQYLRPISSRLLSLNQVRTSARIGQASPHISTQGTCTYTCLLSISPLMPAKGKRIIARSCQKNVFLVFASGRNRSVALCPSSMFQCG